MPVKANNSMKHTKKPVNEPALVSVGRVKITPTTASIITIKLTSVTLDAANLSDNLPPTTRISAPTNGPRKAYLVGSTSGNTCLVNKAKPAEKPMKEPKVPI